jgi:imidazolonepropionase-like amidohydrolase
MRKLLFVLVLLVVPVALPAQTSTLFRSARVFDGERILDNTDVLVRGGRIAALGRNVTAPAGAEIVEARGRTLRPGFFGAHTHAFGEALRDALIFGVTTELDMFTEPRMA